MGDNHTCCSLGCGTILNTNSSRQCMDCSRKCCSKHLNNHNCQKKKLEETKTKCNFERCMNSSFYNRTKCQRCSMVYCESHISVHACSCEFNYCSSSNGVIDGKCKNCSKIFCKEHKIRHDCNQKDLRKMCQDYNCGNTQDEYCSKCKMFYCKTHKKTHTCSNNSSASTNSQPLCQFNPCNNLKADKCSICSTNLCETHHKTHNCSQISHSPQPNSTINCKIFNCFSQVSSDEIECSNCKNKFCTEHSSNHGCSNPAESIKTDLGFLEPLKRIRSSTYKTVINEQKKLLKNIEELNNEYIKIDELLCKLEALASTDEHFKENLKNIIQEFNTKSESKASIKLLKAFKSELKDFFRSIKESNSNPRKNNHSSSALDLEKKEQQLKAASSRTFNARQLIPISTKYYTLNNARNIDELENILNENRKFFKYFRISEFDMAETYIFAIFESAFRYIKSESIYQKFFSDFFNGYHAIPYKDFYKPKNPEGPFSSKNYTDIQNFLSDSKKYSPADFFLLLGIYEYDFKNSSRLASPINIYTNNNSYFDIFIIKLSSDKTYILMPYRKYAKQAKYLWVKKPFFLTSY